MHSPQQPYGKGSVAVQGMFRHFPPAKLPDPHRKRRSPRTLQPAWRSITDPHYSHEDVWTVLGPRTPSVGRPWMTPGNRLLYGTALSLQASVRPPCKRGPASVAQQQLAWNDGFAAPNRDSSFDSPPSSSPPSSSPPSSSPPSRARSPELALTSTTGPPSRSRILARKLKPPEGPPSSHGLPPSPFRTPTRSPPSRPSSAKSAKRASPRRRPASASPSTGATVRIAPEPPSPDSVGSLDAGVLVGSTWVFAYSPRHASRIVPR